MAERIVYSASGLLKNHSACITAIMKIIIIAESIRRLVFVMPAVVFLKISEAFERRTAAPEYTEAVRAGRHINRKKEFFS